MKTDGFGAFYPNLGIVFLQTSSKSNHSSNTVHIYPWVLSESESESMEEILGDKELLSKYAVGSVPTVLYIPEYVSASEEAQLLKNVCVDMELHSLCYTLHIILDHLPFAFADSPSPAFQVEVFEESETSKLGCAHSTLHNLIIAARFNSYTVPS